MKYRAVYERDADGRWIVEIPQVQGCHTYGRTIDQARERIREALKLFVANAEAVELVDQVRLPSSVQKVVRDAQTWRDKFERARTRAAAAERRAVDCLRSMKLGHRDAGSILGLSHQRVHQLEHQVSGTVIEARRRLATKKR
jgi:predicted RNase H-like HicB family nuclease